MLTNLPNVTILISSQVNSAFLAPMLCVEVLPLLLTQYPQFSPPKLASVLLIPISCFCDITFLLNKTSGRNYNNNISYKRGSIICRSQARLSPS